MSIDRGEFLKLAGISLVLAACGVKVPETAIPTSTTEPTPMHPDVWVRKLFEVISFLPESPYKNMLLDTSKLYFSDPPPTEINFNGVNINILRPTIVTKLITNDKDHFGGYFSFRGSHVDESQIKEFFPLTGSTIPLPLPLIVKEEELGIFRQNNLLINDQTPSIKIEFPEEKSVYSYLAPYIEIRSLLPQMGNEARNYVIDSLNSFSLIKEVLGLAIFHEYVSETIRIMKDNNLPTHLLMTDGSSQEIITQSLASITFNKGRFLAAMDIAGYIMAIKATQGTDIIEVARGYAKPWNQYIGSVEQTDFGQNQEKIVENVLRWAITSQDASNFIHQGDLRKIPGLLSIYRVV